MVQPSVSPPRILFACTLNAVRSPMAAAILQHLAGPRVRVMSAGVRRGHADPFVMAVMDEIGIDVTAHQPKVFRDLGRETFSTIVTLSPEAQHHAVELTRIMKADVEYWPTFDPSMLPTEAGRAAILAAYRKLRDDLLEKIKHRFAISGGPTV
ncbi:MAG: low molecular weight phosphatase family protein [Deltaproteobacteria bacterium]